MIMELPDSTGGDRNNNPPPPPLPLHHHHDDDSRSGLGIDLNEIPSPSFSFAETLPDSAVDIVRAYHENPAPPPGDPVALPRGSIPCASCGGVGGGQLLVCDGCERGFHLACAGIRGGSCRQAAGLGEWVCGECVSGGVKSKRWPLGVKSKQLLDINASPPSDADGEDLHDLRKHNLGDKSFGAPVTYSNFHNGSAFGFQRASGVVTHAVKVGFEDILNHTQSMTRNFEEVYVDFPLGTHGSSSNTATRIPSRSPNEVFLQALRDFISERHGVLEEGWRVEFRQSMNSSELYAVYCAPDGKIFDSVYEVACYLGLTSGYNSLESDVRNQRSLPSLGGGPHLSRKRKPVRTLVANGFAEKTGTLSNSNCKDPPADGSVECATAREKVPKATGIGKEDCHAGLPQSSDGLPLQFKDFFVLSLGKVDGRPSYYDVNLIFPVGYKSCWHDKLTGSLFTCEILEGGNSGPIFKIRRHSCSNFHVSAGSTTLSISSHCQFVSQPNDGERKRSDNMDLDGDESIQMMLLDPCAPTENDILSCVASCSNEVCDSRASDVLQPVSGSVQDNTRNSLVDNMGFIDEIGEILVEERSSSSAWRVMSQKLVSACKDICQKKGTLKFFCQHVENEPCLHKWDLRNGKSDTHFTSLDKFCCTLSSANIPDVIYADHDLKDLYEMLGRWLEQDRFGLDVEFVQEVLELLPGVQDCLQYELLNSRSNSSSLPTVENGFLVVEWRGESKYQEEALQGLYRRSKKLTLTEKCEHRCPPAGKPLCSRAPSELIGDIFQVWELLGRFHEILDLKEPSSLDELEKELINPWFNGSDFHEEYEKEMDGSQVLFSQGANGNCRPSSSTESSRAFIQVETEAMKEAAQVKLASFTYARCFGVALTKAHNSVLRVLIGELLSKVAALVDPNSEPGETRTRRGRRKDIDSAVPTKRTKVNMLPINELTWPELARRYILAFLSMDGNLESAEITARESGKVFRCLRGDGGLLCGSLTGVAGMEADALVRA